jgi:RimJ/RimL family protein N-acetyltransferase
MGAGAGLTRLPGRAAAGTIRRVTETEQPTANFAMKPTLTGTVAVLRPFDLDRDLSALREMLLDAEGVRLTGSASFPGDELEWGERDEAKFRDWYGTRNDQSDRLDLAITDRATGQCVGEAVLNEWQPANQSCNFRIMIGPRGRDRGLGTDATRLIVGYGFENLGLHRISLEVYDFNPRARRVYEKAGFVAEGVLRDALHWDGAWIDATVMSILAPEWARHRGHP